MKEYLKNFILELVRKETKALTIALETKLKENLKREMNQFKIHLQFRINQKLMRIVQGKKFYQWNFLNMSLNFKRLSETLKLRIRYNLKI